MKALLPFYLFLFQTGFSQTFPETGPVIGNNINSCVLLRDGRICQSENQIEIWLSGATLLIGKYTTVILAYNGLKWQAQRFEGDWINNEVDTFNLKPIISFDSVFSALKRNKIFILPDQRQLKAFEEVNDGTEYSLTFKAEDKFRTYRFDNPDIYSESHKDIPEFKNYENIVRILFDSLKVLSSP